MFSARTQHRTKLIGTLLLAYFAVVGLFALFASRGHTSFSSAYLYWLVAVPIGLAVWAAVESVGSYFLGHSFWGRMSSIGRVALLVVVVIGAIFIVLGAAQLLGAHHAL